MTSELQAIAQRLEKVEKQIADVAALVIDQPEIGRAVVAQSFVVRDARGVRRAELGMVVPVGQTEEEPWLSLFDTNGNVRACIGVEESGQPWLEFYDAKQKEVLQVSVDENGPAITLFDVNGQRRVHVTVSEEYGSSVTLFDPNGKQHLTLDVSPSGTARLFMGATATLFMGAVEGPSLKLAVDSDGPCLLFGRGNKVFWSAP